MVDHYRPAMDALEARIEQLEDEVFAGARTTMRASHPALQARAGLAAPRARAAARRRRRGWRGGSSPAISDEMAYRFRDVYDHLVRVTEEAADLSGPRDRHARGRTCRRCRTG